MWARCNSPLLPPPSQSSSSHFITKASLFPIQMAKRQHCFTHELWALNRGSIQDTMSNAKVTTGSLMQVRYFPAEAHGDVIWYPPRASAVAQFGWRPGAAAVPLLRMFVPPAKEVPNKRVGASPHLCPPGCTATCVFREPQVKSGSQWHIQIPEGDSDTA